MSQATNILEEAVGNHIFRNATWAKPPAIYIGLASAAADPEVGTVTELSYTGYVRKQVPQLNSSWNPPVGSNDTFTNAGTIDFPANTGGGDQTATHAVVYDALAGGNAWFVSSLDTPVTMTAGGDPADFPAGSISMPFNVTTDYLALVIGNHLLRADTWAKPTQIDFGLYQTMPNKDGTGGVELTGGSYAPLNFGPLDANWDAPTAGNGLFKNAVVFTFAQPTATWSFNGGCYRDQGSNILIRNSLPATITRAAGTSSCYFGIGDLTHTFS